jgi:hypothetical protein
MNDRIALGKIVWVFLFFVCSQSFGTQLSPSPTDFEAAWRRLTTETVGGRSTPSKEFCSWFSGFIEGKTGQSPPKWWIDCLDDSDSRAESRFNLGRTNSVKENQFRFGTVAHRGEHILVNKEDLSVSLSRKVFEDIFGRLPSPNDCRNLVLLARGFHEGEVYIAYIHPTAGFPFQLCSFDTEAAEVRWSVRINDEGGRMHFDGLGNHYVELRTESGAISIWGVDSGMLYFQILNPDGRSLWHFSSFSFVE